MKTKKYLFMLATLFSAATGFTACSSEDDLASSEENQERGVVKTEFSISFPQQMGAVTRQSEAIVQGQTQPVFRGLQSIELRPFSIKAENVSTTTAIPSTISLGSTEILKNATGTDLVTLKPTATNQVSKSHLYKNLEIPIGTKSFMFYGVAKDELTTTDDHSHNVANGALTKTEGSGTLENVTISPVQIYATGTVDQQGSDIAAYLTGIATASVTIDEQSKTTLYYFPSFSSITSGSWKSAKAVVLQLYKSVYKLAEYDTDGKVTNTATNLYSAIVNAITKQYTFGSGKTARNVTFVTAEGKDTNNKRNGTLTFSTAYSYPANINLPDGAAFIEWNATDSQFNPANHDNMEYNSKNIASLGDYVYPASLYYYGLSNVIAVGTSMETHYTSSNTWKDITDKYNAETDASDVVGSTTRSIAIEKEVQYAVGRLDVTVVAQDGLASLKDADGTDVALGAGVFPITGILVGNQRIVDYKFEAKDKSASARQYVIYDSQVTEGTPYLYSGSTPSIATHTLVLETPQVDNTLGTTTEGGVTFRKDPNADVPIAVEFENRSGKTFIGKDKELIYPDTKFYLIGTLHPDKNTTQTYDGNPASATNPAIKKAFVKDYVTTAHFKVSSLANAYNIMPDLRTPHLEIGLSVDLTWQTGITQEITIQ